MSSIDQPAPLDPQFSGLNSARILLIDDAPFPRQVLQSLLDDMKSSHTLEWRDTAAGGLEALVTGTYDVCFLDYHLGTESGVTVLRQAVERGCRTPIVMLTGEGDRALDLEAMRAGATDYLEKGELTPESFDRIIRYNVERARTLERLRESEERYALASNGANDGIWDWKVGAPTLHFSARWRAMLGLGDGDISDSLESWLARVHPEDVVSLQQALDGHVEGTTPHLEHEHRLLHADGTWVHVLVRGQAVRNEQGRATRIAGSLTDLTRVRARDPLTGLPNRVLYRDRVERAFLRTKRDPGYRFAVLFVDLDRFKVINDSLGHGAGDQLLVGIARRLEECVRGVDTVARLGGDEFVLLLEDVREPDGPVRVANRIVEELGKPFALGDRDVFTGASIGIALSAPSYQRPEEMLRDADTAMYRAKTLGKSRAVVFDRGMHEKALAVLTVESELRRAIEANQLDVYYQPVVRLDDRQLIGFEALVRWNHPQRGLISPNDFVPIAEDTSLVVALDRFVLERALKQLATWQAQGEDELFMSVNASRRQFALPQCADLIEATLLRTGMSAKALRLEVTESVAMDPSPVVAAQLQRVSALGVQLVVDDFGIGYSSLSLLHKYPFRGLKIDRSFIMQLDTSAQAREVVKAIVALATALELTVTAEGVETEPQLAAITALGAEQAQGYYFGRPLPSAEATKVVRRRGVPLAG